MIINYIVWFLEYGLSFLVSDVLGWTDQGRAFFFINIIPSIMMFCLFLLVFTIAIIQAKDDIKVARNF